MFRAGKMILVLAAAAVACGGALAKSTDDQMCGMILGKTGELLEIRLPQPVRDGAIFLVKSILSEPPIAEAKVVSCTKEWPYIALAKVVKADLRTSIPIGAKAFTDVDSVDPEVAPKPMPLQPAASDTQRFSVQVGSFYPRPPVLRDTVADFWQEYRLNYSFLKLKTFELTFSGAYSKGSGDFPARDGGTITRSVEVIPVTLLGRFRLVRVGSLSLVVGAGGGVYRVRSRTELGETSTSNTVDKVGHEFTASLESLRGWALELRYRDVPNTQIQGFSLALGGRF